VQDHLISTKEEHEDEHFFTGHFWWHLRDSRYFTE
jgi:hypothetical protein